MFANPATDTACRVYLWEQELHEDFDSGAILWGEIKRFLDADLERIMAVPENGFDGLSACSDDPAIVVAR